MHTSPRFWLTAATSAAFLGLAPMALAALPASPPAAQATTSQPAEHSTMKQHEKIMVPGTTPRQEQAQFQKNHPATPTHMKTKFGTRTGTHS